MEKSILVLHHMTMSSLLSNIFWMRRMKFNRFQKMARTDRTSKNIQTHISKFDCQRECSALLKDMIEIIFHWRLCPCFVIKVLLPQKKKETKWKKHECFVWIIPEKLKLVWKIQKSFTTLKLCCFLKEFTKELKSETYNWHLLLISSFFCPSRGFTWLSLKKVFKRFKKCQAEETKDSRNASTNHPYKSSSMADFCLVGLKRCFCAVKPIWTKQKKLLREKTKDRVLTLQTLVKKKKHVVPLFRVFIFQQSLKRKAGGIIIFWKRSANLQGFWKIFFSYVLTQKKNRFWCNILQKPYFWSHHHYAVLYHR